MDCCCLLHLFTCPPLGTQRQSYHNSDRVLNVPMLFVTTPVNPKLGRRYTSLKKKKKKEQKEFWTRALAISAPPVQSSETTLISIVQIQGYEIASASGDIGACIARLLEENCSRHES